MLLLSLSVLLYGQDFVHQLLWSSFDLGSSARDGALEACLRATPERGQGNRTVWPSVRHPSGQTTFDALAYHFGLVVLVSPLNHTAVEVAAASLKAQSVGSL